MAVPIGYGGVEIDVVVVVGEAAFRVGAAPGTRMRIPTTKPLRRRLTFLYGGYSTTYWTLLAGRGAIGVVAQAHEPKSLLH